MVGVDPVVDDPDLDPAAGIRELRPPQRRSADRGRAVVLQRAVAQAGIDADDSRRPCEPVELVPGHDDGEAGEHDAVPPADLGAGIACEDPPGDTLLLTPDGLEGRPRTCSGRRAPVALPRGRLHAELDDDLHAARWTTDVVAGVRQGRRRGGEDGEKEERYEAAKDPAMVAAGFEPLFNRPFPGAQLDSLDYESRADVAELVDAHGSGPCGGDPVEVRFLSSAFNS